MKTKVVVATREKKEDFFKVTATGRSLARHRHSPVELILYPENSAGLPSLYNRALRSCQDDPCIIIFCHDDIHILDYFWDRRIADGLDQFDVVGLAGNKRRLPRQPSWAFKNDAFEWDSKENLSGMVGHGKSYPPANVSFYGPTRQKVLLLDGLLLAARSEALIKNNIQFDEQFDFHFYDMDFSRQIEQSMLSCGTWDLSVIHESGGGFNTESWRLGYQRYLEKWGS